MFQHTENRGKRKEQHNPIIKGQKLHSTGLILPMHQDEASASLSFCCAAMNLRYSC